MVFALNTLMWAWKPLESVVAHADRLGIHALDLGALPGCGHLDLSADTTRIRKQIPPLPKGKNWRFVAVTADHPGLSSSDPLTRSAAITYTIRAMETAALLGARVVGTSLGSVGQGRQWAEAAECATIALRQVLIGSPEGVRLAVEVHVNDVCNSLDKAVYFLEAVANPRFGVTFDTSLLHYNRIDIDEAFDRVGGRIFHVHLRGATSETYFAIPGRDEVDFRRFFRRLTEIGYQDALSLELYEVETRYGISTADALAEAIPYLKACVEDALSEYPHTHE